MVIRCGCAAGIQTESGLQTRFGTLYRRYPGRVKIRILTLEDGMASQQATHRIRKDVKKKFRHFNIGAKLWSLAHHGVLFGSAIASASAAVIVQLQDLPIRVALSPTDLSTLLAALAALLATTAAVGGFERKWRANRVSRTRMELLQERLEANLIDIDKALDEYSCILNKHDAAIGGS
jgi:hypothetical protein